MADYSITKSDTVTTLESIDVLDNATRRITVLDNVSPIEVVDVLRAGARNITVLDTTPLSERVDVLKNNSRTVTVSDMESLVEAIGFNIIQSPATVIRTISLTVTIPDALPFVVTKKDI